MDVIFFAFSVYISREISQKIKHRNIRREMKRYQIEAMIHIQKEEERTTRASNGIERTGVKIR
jgi:hypothetical protein